MNRLGKPEHRARFCFFSKKKSLAGMRRFPIAPEIKIRMGFKARPRKSPRDDRIALCIQQGGEPARIALLHEKIVDARFLIHEDHPRAGK